MIYTIRISICLAGVVLAGCFGGSDAPKLVEAEGTVSFGGQSLAGASIVFSPEEGPVSVGISDDEGHFTLTTQGKPGVTVGSHAVSVSAFEQPPPAKSTGDEAAIQSEAAAANQKSRIPLKFGSVLTSGLKANVENDASQNSFSFDLTK